MLNQTKNTSRFAPRNILLTGVMMLVLALATPALAADPTYKVHNIDVGQGSATLVQTLGGKNILFDTGWDFAGDRLTSYLKKVGVKKLDALVISHRHMDHIGGVQKLSEKVPVGKVIGPWAKDGIPKSAMVHLGHLRRDLTKPNGPRNRPLYATATTGKVFDFGKGFVMETLWPRKNSSGKAIGDFNQESVAMRVIQKAPKGGAAATFLVAGDLGVQEERWLARRMPGKLKVDWMVANHHGSRGSSQREYMVAADGGYSKFLKALIAGPEHSDPKVYETALKLKEHSKGKYASQLLHNIDPLAHGKVPIKTKWLDKLAKDVRRINKESSKMDGRYAVFSVGPNSYGHPNAIRLAESQLAGFTPITTWANGSVVMERTLGKNGKWAADWKPKAVSSKGLPTVKAPKWLGQQDPERPYNNDRREANEHWSKNNPQPEVKWTGAWDTSQNWRGLSREISKGRKNWVEEYVKVKKQAEKGTNPKTGKVPRSKEQQAKNKAAGARKLKRMQHPRKSEWHGLRLNNMRELTKEELHRIAIKKEDPNKVTAKAVVKGKWVDKPVAPEHPASFSKKELKYSPGRSVKTKKTTMKSTRKKPAVKMARASSPPRQASPSAHSTPTHGSTQRPVCRWQSSPGAQPSTRHAGTQPPPAQIWFSGQRASWQRNTHMPRAQISSPGQRASSSSASSQSSSTPLHRSAGTGPQRPQALSTSLSTRPSQSSSSPLHSSSSAPATGSHGDRPPSQTCRPSAQRPARPVAHQIPSPRPSSSSPSQSSSMPLHCSGPVGMQK